MKILIHILVFILLTVLTQVGGIIYLISLFTNQWTSRISSKPIINVLLRTCYFLLLYLVSTFAAVPVIAPFFGRVPLPVTESGNLRPLNILTVLLNRHYVRPELKTAIQDIAADMNRLHSGTTINYLDGNFPFLNGFPLLPHLSHNDGRKLDLSFCYRKSATGQTTNDAPSWIGYGVCEEPRSGEKNTAEFCSEKGNWQYSFLTKIVSQSNKFNFDFDETRTRDLAVLITANQRIEKLFIEPHLKTRLHLQSEKIRFHGCQAVRHDDHIHVQTR